jgi:hypothetical protein
MAGQVLNSRFPEFTTTGGGPPCDRSRPALGFPGGRPAPALAGYLVIVSVSSVTAAVRASALPWMVTPVVTVIEARAMMFPLRVE